MVKECKGKVNSNDWVITIKEKESKGMDWKDGFKKFIKDFTKDANVIVCDDMLQVYLNSYCKETIDSLEIMEYFNLDDTQQTLTYLHYKDNNIMDNGIWADGYEYKACDRLYNYVNDRAKQSIDIINRLTS